MFGLSFDKQVDIGNLLTSISVLIALTGLLYSFAKDRSIRQRDYADKVRSTAATALSKLDRCQSLLSLFYDRMQIAITEADEQIVSTRNNVKTRDDFWKKANAARQEILTEFYKEELEISYAPLLPYRPEIYDLFHRTVATVSETDLDLFWDFQRTCQATILDFAVSPPPQSADLGNKLRTVCADLKDEFATKTSSALGAARSFMRALVASSDEEIIEGNRKARAASASDLDGINP